MSGEELQAFAAKLEAWGRGLGPKEQQFLVQLLGRAVAADVAGYAAVDYFLKLTAVEGAGAAAWHKDLGAPAPQATPFLKIDLLPLLRQLGE